jgi:hypothetical protein
MIAEGQGKDLSTNRLSTFCGYGLCPRQLSGDLDLDDEIGAHETEASFQVAAGGAVPA